MRTFALAVLLASAFAPSLPAEELLPEISWGKSFLNGRRDAANGRMPMVVLFYDRVQLDYYDDVLAKDAKLRAAAKGFVFIKVEREADKDLARRLGVKSPWEVRILAPDLSVIKAFTSKVKVAELVAALKGLQKTWTAKGGKLIEWLYSYDEALKLAVEKNRPMMIYFWSDERRGSHPDENPLLKNERVIEISRKFVCLKLNQAIDQALFDKFKVTEVPFLLFVKPNEEVFAGPDGLKVDLLIAYMKEIIAAYETTVESGAQKDEKKEAGHEPADGGPAKQ